MNLKENERLDDLQVGGLKIIQDNILQLPSEFLRKYAKSMLENPCRFMTVYLTPYCSYCGDLIVEEGYKCDTCYNQQSLIYPSPSLPKVWDYQEYQFLWNHYWNSNCPITIKGTKTILPRSSYSV